MHYHSYITPVAYNLLDSLFYVQVDKNVTQRNWSAREYEGKMRTLKCVMKYIMFSKNVQKHIMYSVTSLSQVYNANLYFTKETAPVSLPLIFRQTSITSDIKTH
jgi:hypothetical protein